MSELDQLSREQEHGTAAAGPAQTAAETAPRRSPLDRYFKLTARGTTVATEVRGGLTTFMAMAYIVVLNPLILGGVADATGAQLSPAQLTTATALSAAVATIAMGLIGNVPLALAAGLGVTGVLAFQVAGTMTWPQAMGLVVLEGIAIVVLVASGLRQAIMDAIPLALKHAITIGIGMFVALIGLVNAGFVGADGGTPLELGAGGRLAGWPVAVFCVTVLITLALYARGIPGALLIGITVGSMFAAVVHAAAGLDAKDWGAVAPELPDRLFALPDFGLFGQVDLIGGFAAAGALTATVLLFTLVLAGFFDAMGTIIGVSSEAGLADNKGRLPGIGKVLMVDGASAAFGGTAGGSAQTVFVESTAGVGEGARTGLASVVTGGLFAVCLLFTPLAAIVPAQAAGAALVVIGALMMRQARHIDWNNLQVAIPAFLTIALMPFTYSVSVGVGAGVIAYVLLKAVHGKFREPGWLMWALALIFAAYFGIDLIEQALGLR